MSTQDLIASTTEGAKEDNEALDVFASTSEELTNADESHSTVEEYSIHLSDEGEQTSIEFQNERKDADWDHEEYSCLPSQSTMRHLEEILEGQFGFSCGVQEGLEDEHEIHKKVLERKSSQATELSGLQHAQRGPLSQLVDSHAFIRCFILFALYALFATDLDLCFGTKDSEAIVKIVTTVVFGFFCVEIILYSLGKPGYFLRGFFWLDFIALFILTFDTVIFDSLLGSHQALSSGQSSRLARIVRIATSSFRTARLHRISRVVRIATLFTRVTSGFEQSSKKQQAEEVDKVLDIKLRRIFTFMDEDVDGLVPCAVSDLVLSKMRKHHDTNGIPAVFNQGITHVSNKAAESMKAMTRRLSVTSSSQSGGLLASKENQTEKRMLDKQRLNMDLISFDEFRNKVLGDEAVAKNARVACQEHVRQATQESGVRSNHTERIVLKLAFGVVFLLLVLSVVEPQYKDHSLNRCLNFCSHVMALEFPQLPPYCTMPPLLQEPLRVCMRAASLGFDDRRLLYLDLQRTVVCNQMVKGGQPCAMGTNANLTFQGWRTSLQRVQQEIQHMKQYRSVDILIVSSPLGADASYLDEPDQQITSVAVFSNRAAVQAQAIAAMVLTLAAIVIILAGTDFCTRDLTNLSKRLLRPLRDLADDMESIVQLQIAGVHQEASMDDSKRHAAAEVQLIRQTFENMKKAIASWGKYVPWPVVHMLLRADVEAELDMKEMEVSIFFSDIASFTTIVESISPEDAILLLSRYFRDMSRVIDDHGGIVLEFIGDAILCVYGAPLATPVHPRQAVKAALEMQAALQLMNRWSAKRGLPQVKARSGVHTGKVLVGNLGTTSRMKYGVVGEGAQIPMRLEELNKTYATNILISQSTLVRLSSRSFATRPIDFVGLHETNGSNPELIHEVLMIRADTDKRQLKTALKTHASGIAHYGSREFERAVIDFNAANELMKKVFNCQHDQASALMLDRSKAYIMQPPPRDWVGVWDRAAA